MKRNFKKKEIQKSGGKKLIKTEKKNKRKYRWKAVKKKKRK